jgi:hypothetical protein
MIAVENTLVSDDILKEAFVCDLNRCKGACCVAGDAGAPLIPDELEILEQSFKEIRPFLSAEGVKAIESQGKFVVDEEGEYTTPLIDGNECAYAVFENGTASCGIEQAFLQGKISFRKPISCHLYPIRITEYEGFDAVNYHKWDICSDACSLGKQLKVPVYSFLKEPIIRKYGKSYYRQLEQAARLIKA